MVTGVFSRMLFAICGIKVAQGIALGVIAAWRGVL